MSETKTETALTKADAKSDAKAEASAMAAAADVRMSFDTIGGFMALQRCAAMLASSNIVPKQYKGNIGDCAIAVDISIRLNMSPILVLQNLVPVNGRVGWMGQFQIALVNNCRLFDPIEWEWAGTEGSADWGCRAFAKDRRSGQVRMGAWVTLTMVKAEGWWSNKDRDGIERSKWQTMPVQMFMYRAASFWLRVWYPEGLMGLPTAEEIADVDPAPAGGVTPLSPEVVVVREDVDGDPAAALLQRIGKATDKAAMDEIFAEATAAFPGGKPPAAIRTAYENRRKALLRAEENADEIRFLVRVREAKDTADLDAIAFEAQEKLPNNGPIKRAIELRLENLQGVK